MFTSCKSQGLEEFFTTNSQSRYLAEVQKLKNCRSSTKVVLIAKTLLRWNHTSLRSSIIKPLLKRSFGAFLILIYQIYKCNLFETNYRFLPYTVNVIKGTMMCICVVEQIVLVVVGLSLCHSIFFTLQIIKIKAKNHWKL